MAAKQYEVHVKAVGGVSSSIIYLVADTVEIETMDVESNVTAEFAVFNVGNNEVGRFRLSDIIGYNVSGG